MIPGKLRSDGYFTCVLGATLKKKILRTAILVATLAIGVVCMCFSQPISGYLFFLGMLFLRLSIVALILCFISILFPVGKAGPGGKYGKLAKLGPISIVSRISLAVFLGVTYLGTQFNVSVG